MLERSKVCYNERIMRSLQEMIKRPFKGIIPMRGIWWFTIHVPGVWHMARSPSVTLPGIICWSVPVTLPQVLRPLLLLSKIMPSNNQIYVFKHFFNERNQTGTTLYKRPNFWTFIMKFLKVFYSCKFKYLYRINNNNTDQNIFSPFEYHF